MIVCGYAIFTDRQAQQLVASLLMWRLGFDNSLVLYGSVADKVTLRQGFVKYCVIRILSISIDQ